MPKAIAVLCVVSVFACPLPAAPPAEPNGLPLAWGVQAGSKGIDSAIRVVVDGKGDICLGGCTTGSYARTNPGGTDVWVAKYSPAGKLLYKTQVGTAHNDNLRDVAADEAGNIYVCGETSGRPAGGGEYDAFLIKFTRRCRLDWQVRFGTARDDKARSVVVAADGHIYVGGVTRGGLGGRGSGTADGFVCKYDAKGKVLWSDQFTGTNYDEVRTLATDARGNLYVAGWTDGTLGRRRFGGLDIFVRKYSPDGLVAWTTQLGSSGDDYAYRVAVDANGLIYVAGATRGDFEGQCAGGFDAILVALDPDGGERWRWQLGSPGEDLLIGLAPDRHGRLYVSGRTEGSLGGTSLGDWDGLLGRFDAADGKAVWLRQFGTKAKDSANAIVLDDRGNLLMCGATGGRLLGSFQGEADLFLLKLSAGSAAERLLQQPSRTQRALWLAAQAPKAK